MPAPTSSKTTQKTKSITKVKSSAKVKSVKSKETVSASGKRTKSNVSVGKTKSSTKSVTKSKSALKSTTSFTKNRSDSKSSTKLLECLPKSVNKKTSTVAAKTKLPKVTAMKSRKLARNRPKSRGSVDSESFKFCTTTDEGSDDVSPMVKITIIPSNCGRPGGPEKAVQLQKCPDLVKTTCLDQEQPSSAASTATNSQNALEATNSKFEIVDAANVDVKTVAEQEVNKTEIQANTGQGQPAAALQPATGPPPPSEPTESMQLVGNLAGWSCITALLIVVFAAAAITVGLILAKRA